jgi:hypothetical protein
MRLLKMPIETVHYYKGWTGFENIILFAYENKLRAMPHFAESIFTVL